MNLRKLGIIAAPAFLVGSFAINAYAESKAVSLSGFVDAQAQWHRKAAGNGFVINDGALYLNKEYSNTKVAIDLPFSFAGNTDVNGRTTNDFKFATGKAQAYIGYSLMDGVVSGQVGQWDTIYGFEANDSIDYIYTQPGVVYGVLPTTHTGLLFSVAPKLNFGTVSIKALVADSLNRGNKDKKNLEYGTQAGFSNDYVHTSIGYLFFDEGNKNRQFLDFLAGTTFVQRISLDGEVTMIKDPDAVTGNGNKWGQAYLINVTGKINDVWSAGIRGEMSRKTGLANHGTSQVTVGPQAALTEALKIKADYTWNRMQAVAGGVKVTGHQLNVAALYRF